MATVYKIKMKVISAFVNYNEADIASIFERLIKEHKDKETGLGFEGIEIDVEKL